MAKTRGVEMVARLGGPSEVRAILQRFYRVLAGDVIVGFHFAGRDLEAIVDGQLAFLMKVFGVTSEFAGRHPSVAHTDLAPILRGQFDRRLVMLREVLEEESLTEDECELWLGVERSMRSVVQKGSR